MPSVNLNFNGAAAAAVENASQLVANLANQYIISANNAPPGISGFVFDISDLEEILSQADATDHYIETNSAIQDHVVLKPLKFTVRGYVGELKAIFDVPEVNVFSEIAGLAPISVLLPTFNVQDTQVYQEIADAAAQAQSAIAAIASISSLIPQLVGMTTYQQQAFASLFGMQQNRTLCTVQTPYGLLTNMIIEEVRPSQPGETKFMSSFTVTLKQINQVGTVVVSTAASPNPSGSGVQSGNNATNKPAITDPVNPPPPNYPSQSQSGISSSNASGRAADMLAPPAVLPGSDNVGKAVDFNTTFPQTNQMFATLPSVLAVPPVPILP